MTALPLPKTPPDLADLLTRFGTTAQQFHSRFEARLAPYGLTGAQFSVLTHLVRRGAAQRVTDIARAVEVGQPAVTKMLAKFETAGWVQIRAGREDRRSRIAEATAAGRDHLVAVQRGLVPDLADFQSDWPAEELAQLSLYLVRLGRILDDFR